MLKNKVVKIIIIVVLLILIIIGIFFLYNYLRIKNAKIEVELVDNLTLEFNDKKKVSDFITKINGEIIDDYEIDSTKLGEKEINFKFINDDNIKVSYTYKIEVIDTVSPVVWLSNSYSILKGSDIDLTEKILCGDNYDNNPKCYIEGSYDVNNAGDYSLVFKAEDNSGNIKEQPFTLKVVEPSNNQNSNTNTTKTYTYFEDAKAKYKNDKTKIGLDISSWQGDVDFEKIKAAGVEFVMVRVGYTKGIDGEYVLDTKFIRNMEEAKKHDIDVGVYFYSYANSIEAAKKEAKWVLKQIKDYDIKLPIAYDWEEWGNFNEYNLSFFGLTSMADAFLDTVKKEGYDGMLYSSKAYLESIWLPTDYDIWLAHYTDKTDYEGSYKLWQLCNNGRIDGINGDVDIDIMY